MTDPHSRVQIQVATSDNLQTNDKTMRLLGLRLAEEDIEFIGEERRGQ
jgi:hypothetical protein